MSREIGPKERAMRAQREEQARKGGVKPLKPSKPKPRRAKPKPAPRMPPKRPS